MGIWKALSNWTPRTMRWVPSYNTHLELVCPFFSILGLSLLPPLKNGLSIVVLREFNVLRILLFLFHWRRINDYSFSSVGNDLDIISKFRIWPFSLLYSPLVWPIFSSSVLFSPSSNSSKKISKFKLFGRCFKRDECLSVCLYLTT